MLERLDDHCLQEVAAHLCVKSKLSLLQTSKGVRLSLKRSKALCKAMQASYYTAHNFCASPNSFILPHTASHDMLRCVCCVHGKGQARSSYQEICTQQGADATATSMTSFIYLSTKLAAGSWVPHRSR